MMLSEESNQLDKELDKAIEEADKHIDPTSSQARILRRMRKRMKGKKVGKEKISSERPPQFSKKLGGRVAPPGHEPVIRSDGKIVIHDPKEDRYY